jgi:NADP-dependent 3-hydroxy acid dehydrogenase YdfG
LGRVSVKDAMTQASKLALVTGASSGIGAATARLLATQGYRVVLIGRRRDALQDVAAEIGAAAVVEPCDASDGEAVLAVAERVRREHGVPDVIVNSAGAGQWKRIEHTTPAEAVSMMGAPHFAAFNTTHAFMEGMLDRNSGVIIHIGSPVSLFTWPSSVGYAAARWAMRGMHEALCDDLYWTGVRSCHIVFGKVSSPYFESNPGAEERIPKIAATVRTLTPEACAKIIAGVIRRPRRQSVYPFMMRMYYWMYLLFPWVTHKLMRLSGHKGRD